MAQLVVAAAGAAIGGALLPGFAFLGVTGAGLGWAVGSALGAGLGPSQKVQGPRLNDLKVTGTEYGQPIPYVQGHPRVAGQIWWSSAKREIATTTETGGKGGPSIETTTYTYEVDLLIGLSDNVIGGVSRVWSNGKLVWTKRADSGATSALSGKSQTSWRRLTVYPGAADQLPDPVYEAAVGVGNAPAYRGRGTVFIEGLQLGGSGQIPNLTFEVYTEGTDEGRGVQTLATIPNSANHGITAFGLPGFTHMVIENTTTRLTSVYRFELGLEEVELVRQFTHTVVDGGNPMSANSDVSGMFLSRVNNTSAQWVDENGGATAYTLPYNINNTQRAIIGSRRDDALVIGSGLQSALNNKRLYRYTTGGGTVVATSDAMSTAVRSIAISGGFVYALNAPGAISNATAVWVFDLETMATLDTLSPPANADDGAYMMTDELGNVYCYADLILYRLDGTSWTALKTIPGGILNGQSNNNLGVYGGDLWGVINMTGGAADQIRVVFDSVDLTEPTVREVVDDLLARTGIGSGQVDTSALDDITTPVRGLAVSQVAPVRAVLEQLAAAYFFETYLADKLYFVPRGGASAATIAYNELGATDGERVDDPLPIDTTPDEEIPAQVALTYANADGDYNTASEHSDRLLSNLTTTSTTQLPLALTSAEAKGIADAMVQDTYASRVSGPIQLDVRHLARTPTDVVTLTDDDGSTYRVRLVRRRQQGWRVEFDWVSDDATALASAGVTSGDYTPSLSISLPGPTTLAMLDIPILRDADDAPGAYAAAKPFSASTKWPGAKLMAATGGDFSEVGTFTSRAVMGVTTVALTNWTGGNVFDESGNVTVDVGDGTLSSSTRDAMLDSDANALLVGDEVIQFRLATLVSTGVYKLTGLLRGRRGTDHAMTGHAIGETVVLLRTAGLLRLSYDAARIGVEATYKAVTFGKTLASATARTLTDTGVALMPYAPKNLRVTKTATSNTLTWDRRSRYSYRWPGASALPLGEAAESYDVEVRDGASNLVQSATVTTASLALTGATEVSRLEVGMGWVTESGGSFFGCSLEGPTPGTKYLVGHDASGLKTSQLYIGSQITTALVVGSAYYVSALTVDLLSVPSVTLTNRVYRVDLSAPTTIAAQRDATDLADFGYMAHDGTDLWVTEPLTGNLRALSASTLVATGTVHAVGGSPLGITHSSGDLYFFDNATGELVKFNISGASETWRVSIAPTYVTEIRVVGSLAFVAGYGDHVAVYATSDGSLVEAFTDYQPTYPPRFLDYAGDVVSMVFTSGDGYRLLRMSSSTGAVVSVQPVGDGTSLAYVDGDDVVFVNEAQGVSTDLDAVGYELIPDLTGYTATVYQVSATIGRGYPASITL